MGDWVKAFETTFGTDQMWTELTKAGALIGLVVVFAFGYRVVRRLVGGASKGKAKI